MNDAAVCAYLERIGLGAERPAPTLEALFTLQKAHLSHVPYENMDILDHIPLNLDADALFDKIVTRRRGGYCFELNELFGRLLRALGYGVTDLFARFLRNETTIPMRRHHVLWVTSPLFDGAYLTDVGVGSGSPLMPVKLEEGTEQVIASIPWRMTKDASLGWVLEEYSHEAWCKVFCFTEEPQLPVDFVATSFYCEMAPDSIFNKAPIVALRTEYGRKTIDGMLFKRFSGEDVQVEEIAAGQLDRVLKDEFGIVRG